MPQHQGYDLVTSPGQDLDNKGSSTQGGLIPQHAGLWLGYLAWQTVPEWHYHWQEYIIPPTVLVQGELQNSSRSIWGLKPDPEASQVLQCTFKPQTKSVRWPLKEEVVTTDASKEGYGYHRIACLSEVGGLCRRARTNTSTFCTRDSMDGFSEVWGMDKGEDHLHQDREQNSSGVSGEKGGSHCKLKWSCEEDPAQVPPE